MLYMNGFTRKTLRREDQQQTSKSLNKVDLKDCGRKTAMRWYVAVDYDYIYGRINTVQQRKMKFSSTYSVGL